MIVLVAFVPTLDGAAAYAPARRKPAQGVLLDSPRGGGPGSNAQRILLDVDRPVLAVKA